MDALREHSAEMLASEAWRIRRAGLDSEPAALVDEQAMPTDEPVPSAGPDGYDLSVSKTAGHVAENAAVQPDSDEPWSTMHWLQLGAAIGSVAIATGAGIGATISYLLFKNGDAPRDELTTSAGLTLGLGLTSVLAVGLAVGSTVLFVVDDSSQVERDSQLESPEIQPTQLHLEDQI